MPLSLRCQPGPLVCLWVFHWTSHWIFAVFGLGLLPLPPISNYHLEGSYFVPFSCYLCGPAPGVLAWAPVPVIPLLLCSLLSVTFRFLWIPCLPDLLWLKRSLVSKLIIGNWWRKLLIPLPGWLLVLLLLVSALKSLLLCCPLQSVLHHQPQVISFVPNVHSRRVFVQSRLWFVTLGTTVLALPCLLKIQFGLCWRPRDPTKHIVFPLSQTFLVWLPLVPKGIGLCKDFLRWQRPRSFVQALTFQCHLFIDGKSSSELRRQGGLIPPCLSSARRIRRRWSNFWMFCHPSVVAFRWFPCLLSPWLFFRRDPGGHDDITWCWFSSWPIQGHISLTSWRRSGWFSSPSGCSIKLLARWFAGWWFVLDSWVRCCHWPRYHCWLFGGVPQCSSFEFGGRAGCQWVGSIPTSGACKFLLSSRRAGDGSASRDEGQFQKICTSKESIQCPSYGSTINGPTADEAPHSPSREVGKGRCAKCSRSFRSSAFKHQGCSVSFCRVAGTAGTCVLASPRSFLKGCPDCWSSTSGQSCSSFDKSRSAKPCYRDGGGNRRCQQWSGESFESAEHGHYCPRCTSCQLVRPPHRTSRWWVNFWYHKRCAKKGAHASRVGCRNFHLLPPDDAAVAPKITSCVASSQERSRVESSFLPQLHGEDRWLSWQPRDRIDYVAIGPHHRCSSARRSTPGQRKIGPTCYQPGAKCGRQGGLADCIPAFIGGGSSTSDLPGQDVHHISLWSSLCQSSSFSMGSSGPCLRQGVGGADIQKGGGVEQESLSFKSCRDRCPANFTQEEGKVSKEASGGSTSQCMKKPSSAEISPLVQDTQSVCLGSSKDCVASDRGEKGTKPSVPASLHSLSLAKWCANLVTLVFRSRTSFAAFARASIHLPRDSIVSTSPAFPIPLPCVGVFNRMPSGLSARQRAKLHFRRALVLIVLSLNFWWSGNRFIDPNLLKRSPSKQQQQIIARVAAFVRADGPRVPFPLSSVGRRVPKLIARLSELSELLTSAGPGSSPYEKSFEGREALLPADNTVADELEPYRSLDASRLRIVGKGHWDPTEFLSDGLVMAFRNPDCLLFDRSSAAPVPKITDPMPEVVSLAKLWDNYGLLVLHEFDVPTLYPDEQVKVFNCYKDASCDRQIGDRRGRNAYERKVEGPSKVLPAGPDLCEFDFDIRTHRLSVSITDRKDFYHQFRVPFSRAVSNTLGPSIPRAYLESTGAFADLLARKAMPIDRLTCGDQLGSSGRFPKLPRKTADDLFVSFGSILQGDHGGVEYACDSHQGLLQSFNLLQPSTRIAANRPFRGSTMMDGLVIDDYFSVSAVPRDSPETSPDVEAFNTAQLAYEKFSLLGSPTKDVVGESSAKVIGASINASELSRQEGICLLGAPGQKRFTLSWISLQLCTMSFTTDVLHLCLVGGWVSCLGFRRPMMSLLNESFRLVDANTINPNEPRVIRLPRVVANELLLLALLCPLAATDLCARFAPCVFSTDASIEKGAICSAPVPVDFARILWRSSRSKGSYHRLMTPMEALSKNLGIHEELPESSSSYVDRPLAFHYDFIEVFSGASTVTKALDLLGYVVGPPVDLSISPEYDVSFVHVMEWLSFMVSEGLLQSVMVEPPCTTFSIIRRPALRSKLCPFGFNPTFRQTKIGNLLACRALQLMVLCHVNFVAGVLEKPFTSLLKHFPSYQALLGRDGVSQCRTDSCMFGSIHRKSFSFLGVHIDLSNLEVECDRSHTHVPIEGSYTKKSATYTPSLAEALAVTLGVAIDRRRASIQDLDRADMKGLENQLVNAVALRAPWTVDAVWDFKKNSHINILEFSVLERLAKRLASQCSPLRVTCLVDSHVVSAASAKGRTSPKGLGPVLRRFCAISVACGLYFSVPFVPTRLNVADDPTRSVPLRQASGGLCPFDWERNALYDLAMLPKLRRWASNWVRLILSLCGPSVLSWSDRSLFRRRFPVLGRPVAGVPPLSQMDFDCTLGFPGEGPSVAVLTCLLALLTHGALCCTVGFSKVFPKALVSVAVLSSHGSAMRPQHCWLVTTIKTTGATAGYWTTGSPVYDAE